jgi:endonuclease-3
MRNSPIANQKSKIKNLKSEAGAPTLRGAVKILKKHYGLPVPPPTTDPFELVLWLNVAYLARPSRRLEAFEQLKSSVGTSPAAILSASPQALESTTSRGILQGTFAARLRECALIAINEFGGDLESVIRGPISIAKRALRSFPGIGEPSAERILLLTGQQALLAPESNGLRVLTRLGFVQEQKSYARTYAASREPAKDLGSDCRQLQEAHLLLQQHGQTLCKYNAPLCAACPLVKSCAYARRVRLAST